jgi:hypothetical protein
MAAETKESKFVNPFEKGVTYTEFLKSIPKGTTVEKHCEKQLTEAEISWIVTELASFEANEKSKVKAIKTAETESDKTE